MSTDLLERSRSETRKREHVVHFYRDEDYLCDVVAEFLDTGARQGETLVVIATQEHMKRIEAKLGVRGTDVRGLMGRKQLVELDADAVLSEVMVGGCPDRERFEDFIGGLVDAARGARADAPVRLYGEMVDVLVRRGNLAGAVEVEELWNDLQGTEEFGLLCAYTIEHFTRADWEVFERVHCAHTHVRPSKETVGFGEGNVLGREMLLLAHQLAVAEAEHTKLYADARALSRSKDETLASIAHELRAPLQAILGWVCVLRDHAPSPEQTRRGLAVIERNALAQAQLIEDLVDNARLSAGKMRFSLQPTELPPLVEAAIESARPSITAKGITITGRIDAGVGPVAADATRLSQVVWNLLANAVKFTPKGGEIHVTLGRENGDAVLSVRDTGKGIPPDQVHSVFDRFVQAGPNGARSGGLGLGLAIARRIVELHSGTIVARSEGVGRGTTFVVRLPILTVT